MAATLTREQVLRFRVRAQQLDRERGSVAETAVLDLGVQDTGPDGGLWALAARGVEPADVPDGALSTAWTLRGAPHLYRRADLPAVAAATAPFSEADAGKRIFDASRPLKAAGIPSLAALDAVAAAMREIVSQPMVKGQVSALLATRMPEPYLRECRPCRATHPYEMPFRLAALRAGLELQAGTSPPVLQPVPDFRVAATVPERLDVVRGYLRLLGPATPKQIAEYLDAPVNDVTARWPADTVEVDVEGDRRWVLADDLAAFDGGAPSATRLLGPYDLFLQARDRPLLVAERERAAELWRMLGRPGAVLVGAEIAGTWRARRSGKGVAVSVALWHGVDRPVHGAIEEQAERLAAFRASSLSAVEVSGPA